MVQITRAALITGGGTGIGAAAAKLFAAQGTAVAVVGRRPGPLAESVRTIRSAGGTALAIPADLADPATPGWILAEVAKAWGRLDVLVNNAAAIKHLPIDQATLDVFNQHMAVNVRAPYFLTQAALPYLRRSDSAAVINISSSSGSLAIPGQCMYGTSKAALEYQTRSLAAELAPLGIRVNAIAPGPVDTPIHLSWAGDDVAGAYERMAREVPLGRMGVAEDLAAWIVWLASSEASWVTGVVIPVDGGQTLPGATSKIVRE
ncbi:MAG: SDR family NAD(P)-dependent oxidoreductase [Anaerolineales bacterium]|jgi:NAD(P)-dependent dehydrogenase (short-subunit alcohol dehydrogenase family)